MSNVVSDFVHLFAGVFFGAVVSYVLCLNNNVNINVDFNLNHKTIQDSENDVDSKSNIADFDLAYNDLDHDDDDEEEDHDSEEESEEYSDDGSEEEEKNSSGNEADNEELKKD